MRITKVLRESSQVRFSVDTDLGHDSEPTKDGLALLRLVRDMHPGITDYTEYGFIADPHTIILGYQYTSDFANDGPLHKLVEQASRTKLSVVVEQKLEGEVLVRASLALVEHDRRTLGALPGVLTAAYYQPNKYRLTALALHVRVGHEEGIERKIRQALGA